MLNQSLIKYSKYLDELKDYLETEAEIYSEKINYPDDAPAPALVLNLKEDEKGRERFVSVAFTPLEDLGETFEKTNNIQVYSEMPFNASDKTFFELSKFILSINNIILAGHISVNDEKKIFLRFSHFYPKNTEITNPSLIETIFFSVMFLDNYSNALEKVVLGELTAKEAEEFIKNI